MNIKKINFILSYIGIWIFLILALQRMIIKNLEPFKDGEILLLCMGFSRLFNFVVSYKEE